MCMNIGLKNKTKDYNMKSRKRTEKLKKIIKTKQRNQRTMHLLNPKKTGSIKQGINNDIYKSLVFKLPTWFRHFF